MQIDHADNAECEIVSLIETLDLLDSTVFKPVNRH